MKPTKCHLILNPKSRGGKSGRQFEKIFRLIEEAGIEYDYVLASTYEGMREASALANEGDYDAIVAVGGDGTINAVINGFYSENGSVKSDKMMAVIYTGTSPDFCKSYGISLNIAEAVNIIKLRNTRKIRIGSIRFRTNLNPVKMETRYFACCASIGIGAMVAGSANRYRKYLGDTFGTMTAIFDSLVRFKAREVMITTSKEEKVIPAVTNIFVGRTKYIASGLKVKDEIADDDDRFYILSVKNLKFQSLPGLLRQLYSGNIANSPVIDLMKADSVFIQSNGFATEVEFDGDPAGFTPCTIQIAGSPLSLITAGNGEWRMNEF